MTTCKVGHSFFLPCNPMPTPRPRATTRGGKFASVYHPADYTKFKANLTEMASVQNDRPPAPYTGPLTVRVIVLVEKARTSKLPHPTPDVDNYAKGILDAITASGVFWVDDKQIVELNIIKRWTDDHAAPGYYVSLTQRI
jgi:Holliday junction resolvase RusA-like endonuclease